MLERPKKFFLTVNSYLVSRLFIESGPWKLRFWTRVAQDGLPRAVLEPPSPPTPTDLVVSLRPWSRHPLSGWVPLWHSVETLTARSRSTNNFESWKRKDWGLDPHHCPQPAKRFLAFYECVGSHHHQVTTRLHMVGWRRPAWLCFFPLLSCRGVTLK